eukprot:9893801-Heterocapsa_arctica.AAC.1
MTQTLVPGWSSTPPDSPRTGVPQAEGSVQFPLLLALIERGAALAWRDVMDLPQGVARGLLRLGSRNHAARWQAWR